LKAVIVEKTDEVPPKIHDLKALAKRGDIMDELLDNQLDLLEQLNSLQIEARYPQYRNKMSETLTLEKCKKLYIDTELFLCWIKKKLGRLPKDMQM